MPQDLQVIRISAPSMIACRHITRIGRSRERNKQNKKIKYTPLSGSYYDEQWEFPWHILDVDYRPSSLQWKLAFDPLFR